MKENVLHSFIKQIENWTEKKDNDRKRKFHFKVQLILQWRKKTRPYILCSPTSSLKSNKTWTTKLELKNKTQLCLWQFKQIHIKRTYNTSLFVLDYIKAFTSLCHCLYIQILISDQISGLRCIISNITFIPARVCLSHKNRKDNSGVRKESWQTDGSALLEQELSASLQNNKWVDERCVHILLHAKKCEEWRAVNTEAKGYIIENTRLF